MTSKIAKKKPLTKKEHAEKAAHAMSDLYVLGAIISICESSSFSPDAFSVEARIVKICKDAQQQALKRYDRYFSQAFNEI